MLLRILRKALLSGSAFFLVWSSLLQAACVDGSTAEPVKVAYVYDGDTVRLTDGRRIRLIGINAPEIQKDGRAGEVFAAESHTILRELLKRGDISLRLGREPQDRYKRWLGHLYVGPLLVAEYMLEQGAAYHVVIPPNLLHSECLQSVERSAAKGWRGVWGLASPPWREVSSLKVGEGGFRLLQGRVTAAKRIKTGWIVEVDDLLALKLSKQLSLNIGLSRMGNLKGVKVRVRGWVREKSANSPAHYQPWFMSVTHKMHIELAL